MSNSRERRHRHITWHAPVIASCERCKLHQLAPLIRNREQSQGQRVVQAWYHVDGGDPVSSRLGLGHAESAIVPAPEETGAKARDEGRVPARQHGREGPPLSPPLSFPEDGCSSATSPRAGRRRTSTMGRRKCAWVALHGPPRSARRSWSRDCCC